MRTSRVSSFFLAGDTLVKKGHHQVVEVRVIDEQEYERIAKAVGTVNDFNANYALYEICAKNYTEIVQFYEGMKKRFEETHYMGPDFYFPVIQETNRLLMNYLSGFRTFIDHYEKRLKNLDRQGNDFFRRLDELTALCFDTSFAYRFFYKLRNYIQHCGMPVGGVGAHIHADDQGKPVAYFSIYFDRDALISNFDKWGKVRQDLQAQPEHIDLLVHLDDFQMRIEDINLLCTEIEFGLMLDSWNYLGERIDEIRTQHPDAFPFVLRIIEFADGRKHMSALNFPIYTMQRIQNWAMQGKLAEES